MPTLPPFVNRGHPEPRTHQSKVEAERLATELEMMWEKHGWTTAKFEAVEISRAGTIGKMYGIRSNLKGGLPPKP